MEIQLEQTANNGIASVLDAQRVQLENNTILSIPCYIDKSQIMENLGFSFKTMVMDDVTNVLGRISLLIIGLNSPVFLDDKLRIALHKKKIGVEVMNIHSASHAFNVLLSESRQVGLLLLKE